MPKLCGVLPAIRDRSKRVVYLVVCRKCGLIHIGINKERSAMERWGAGFADIEHPPHVTRKDWYRWNPKHRECTFDIYWYRVEKEDQPQIEKILQGWAKNKKLGKVDSRCKAKAKRIRDKFESESAVDFVLSK